MAPVRATARTKISCNQIVPKLALSSASHRSTFSLFLIALVLNQNVQLTLCESKEFEWSELGLGRSSLGNAPSNNLRILVSPQRRVSKGYEFDYSNNSQPISSSGETTYVIPNSNGQYVSSSGSQMSGSVNGPSAAYSALSASLANLKSRLNARNVQLGDPNGSAGYGSSLTLTADPQQQQQNGQSSYLSVPSSQDHSSSVGVGNSGSENKTIVLAIPAKINFLSENRSSLGYKQQQSHMAGQQLTVIQPSNEQYYAAGKQIDDQSGLQAPGQNQDSQQYMIVNPQAGSANGQPNPMLAGGGTLSLAQGASVYQTSGSGAPGAANTYQPIAQSPPITQYGIKYVPVSYQPQPPQQQPQPMSAYDSLAGEQGGSTRYISCPDTCNAADSRWRKYSAARYRACCSRYSVAQYDAQYDQPSAAKVGETAQKYVDDSQYQYLYKRSRSRRSRRPKSSRYNRYTSSSDEESSTSDAPGSQAPSRQTQSGRSYYPSYESPYMRYYRNRQSPSTADVGGERQEGYSPPSSSYDKYGSSEGRGSRRSRARDQESIDSGQPEEAPEEESGGSSYADAGNRSPQAVPGSYPPQPNEEVDDARGPAYDEPSDSDSGSKAVGQMDSTEYGSDGSADSGMSEQSSESEGQLAGRYPTTSSRRKKSNKTRNGSRKSKDQKYPKRTRKNKYNKTEQSSRLNATDYESTQPGDQYPSAENGMPPNGSEDDSQSGQKDSPGIESISDSLEKDLNTLGNKYKTGLNESTVASLSKTTMHLKEILSILEKKAQLKLNDTSSNQYSGQQTTTSPPTTTANLNSLSSLLDSPYSSQSLSSALTSEFLSPELGLKTPYRLEASSLSSALPSLSSSSLSSALSSAYSPYSSDPLNMGQYPLGQYPSKYTLGSPKSLPIPNVNHPRKRRVNKNVRYNNLMYPHGPSALGGSSLLHPNKHPFLKSNLYSTLQYPYWYSRTASPSVTNFYPYKNVNKTPYSPLMYSLG